MALPPPPPSPQTMNVNLEFSLPVDLVYIRDADQLHAPLAFVAPLALGFVFIAKAFAAAGPPHAERRSDTGRRSRRGVDSDGDGAGPDLSTVLNQLNIRTPACQALVVCETHRMIASLPEPLLHHYRRLSGSLRGVHHFSSSATLGLNRGDCRARDGERCKKTPLELLLNTGLFRQRRNTL
ncbi:hypothetical protein FJT64_005283 [Amphibalanus amphitrite]|uniref:Uncharacterized protein n=1 Tax=Amphibalanus amphitrite TaxID=1232801 RepID=A0A6A4W0H1_AMPAM|nr:hypothetical protein FJT64_005283 [Amphibalanus amphitrite]